MAFDWGGIKYGGEKSLQIEELTYSRIQRKSGD